MRRVRGARRRSRGAKQPWAIGAIAVSLSIGAGVLVANSYGASPTQSLQTSAFVRFDAGWGRGGNVMIARDGRATVNGAPAPISQQARQRLSVKRETSKQWLASYGRVHAQAYQYYLRHRRLLAQEYQNLLRNWRHHRPGGRPSATATSTATPTATATTTQTTTPTAPPTTTPPASSTATATATPTAATTTPSPTATTTTASPTTTATTTSPTAAATTMSPTATATATPTATATTASPTATATTASPTATATPATTPTVTPTASPTTTTPAGVTQATSPDWAGYAATGAAGTFTSVASNWIVPPVACNGTATRSSYAVGLDGDGTSTIEQIGTEGDCAGDFGLYSGWYQMSPNAPVFFKNPVKPGDAMTASVTALGGGNFMLSLFDMTQNWTQVTQQTLTAATLGSAEIVAQDPPQNGQAPPLSNFGIVDFLGAAINNAAVTAPVNEVTMVSAAGNTLAVPSTITGGVGNFAVGWDAPA
jgi:peptidase A4-like protein